MDFKPIVVYLGEIPLYNVDNGAYNILYSYRNNNETYNS